MYFYTNQNYNGKITLNSFEIERTSDIIGSNNPIEYNLLKKFNVEFVNSNSCFWRKRVRFRQIAKIDCKILNCRLKHLTFSSNVLP